MGEYIQCKRLHKDWWFNKMATIKDVAKQSGVSIATVSRVINGSIKVKPETREAVLKTIKELNYTPNAIAQGLQKKKNNGKRRRECRHNFERSSAH